MIKYYKFVPELKKQMLKKWLNSQKKFRIARVVSIIFYIVAILVCVGCFMVVALLSNDGVGHSALSSNAIGLITGFLFGLIPFSIGQVVYNKSKNEYGRPYCRMTNEYLCTDEKGIQFGYHSTENKYTESMDVYQILYEDITHIDFDEAHNIVTIVGSGELLVYDDISTKRINRQLSGRRFYSNSPYSFILAFEEQREFLDLIRSQKNKEE